MARAKSDSKSLLTLSRHCRRTLPRHGNIVCHREHGNTFAQCLTCGASWSVHDSSAGPQLEEVSRGDGFCDDQATRAQ